jgi:hypothetical protein
MWKSSPSGCKQQHSCTRRNKKPAFCRARKRYDAGQDGTPKPFLSLINWIKIGKDWKAASENILPVPPAPEAKS